MNEVLAYRDASPPAGGSATFLTDEELLSTPCGTPGWNASEIARTDPDLSTLQAGAGHEPLVLEVRSEEEFHRVQRVLRKFQSLLELEANWDSYQARRPQVDLVEAAVRLTYRLIRAGAPEPHVVPTNRGGVQLEWSHAGRELEIEVLEPSRFDVVYEDEATGDIFEGEVTGSSIGPILEQAAKLLAAEQVADPTAA